MLVLEDEIILSTRLGSSSVQLYLGDITDLSIENKVDIIFTSAFPGDYSAAHKTTLIHALKSKLGISVNKLAKNKDLDLRAFFSCWMSARLPDHLPFGRLVCFEINRDGATIADQMSMVFRAMMPIFNGNESTIITPILATGCQHAPLDAMLRVMVSNALYWIRAGLPLKCIKLVLYTANPDRDRQFLYKSSIEQFGLIKKKWEFRNTQNEAKETYDVCFCYAKSDEHWMTDVSRTLVSRDHSLKMYKELFIASTDDSWQEVVFNILSCSRRIIIILTPTFVSDPFCLEQFSLGLCCNRLKGDNVLIPFYIESVTVFPSYMNLIQYTECRARYDGETVEGKITSACAELVTTLHTDTVTSDPADDQGDVSVVKESPIYDVFVSYSHRNPEMARALVELMGRKYPELYVFFDRSELKSGNVWQQTLYEAVDRTRCFVAMLTDSYLKSSVCQEEFNIALARYTARDQLVFTSVCLPELSSLPASHRRGHHVTVSDSGQLEVLCDKMAAAAVKAQQEEKEHLQIGKIKDTLSRHRMAEFNEKYFFDKGKVVGKKENTWMKLDVTGTVTFSYVHDGLKCAAILSELLKMEAPNVSTTLLSGSEAAARREIDSSDIVVAFVSDEYLQSPLHMQELHMALCKQRALKDSTVLYLVKGDHSSPRPFYPHLLPFNVSLSDRHWVRQGKRLTNQTFKFLVYCEGMQGTYMCSSAQYLALQQAKEDILELLMSKGQGSNFQTNVLNVLSVKNRLANTEPEDLKVDQVALSVSELSLSPLATDDATDEKDNEVNYIDDDVDADADEAETETDTVAQGQQTTVTSGSDTGGKAVMTEMNAFFQHGKLKSRYSYLDTSDAVNADGNRALKKPAAVELNVTQSAAPPTISPATDKADGGNLVQGQSPGQDQGQSPHQNQGQNDGGQVEEDRKVEVSVTDQQENSGLVRRALQERDALRSIEKLMLDKEASRSSRSCVLL
ncbi:uncharacterized protein LOC101852264 [Aplysia californica]|uniref:Uncharacterized protein LOC101852264 n=1 Tax=Aplysia californica TaxID=6500 RepID=A0ABM1A7R7_APLCA|nr:uncharacterized protein LOC101852264 [Aplysia californica]